LIDDDDDDNDSDISDCDSDGNDKDGASTDLEDGDSEIRAEGSSFSPAASRPHLDFNVIQPHS
jgi:hypothetical protein